MSVPLRSRDLFGALLDAVTLYGRKTRIIEDVRRQPESYGQLLKATLALGRLLARHTTVVSRSFINAGPSPCAPASSS